MAVTHDWNRTLIRSARHSCMQSGKTIVVLQRPLQSSRGLKKTHTLTHTVRRLKYQQCDTLGLCGATLNPPGAAVQVCAQALKTRFNCCARHLIHTQRDTTALGSRAEWWWWGEGWGGTQPRLALHAESYSHLRRDATERLSHYRLRSDSFFNSSHFAFHCRAKPKTSAEEAAITWSHLLKQRQTLAAATVKSAREGISNPVGSNLLSSDLIQEEFAPLC